MDPILTMVVVVLVIGIVALLIYAIRLANPDGCYNSSLTEEENLNNISQITTFTQFNVIIKDYTDQARTLYKSLIKLQPEPCHFLEEETLLTLVESEEGTEELKVLYNELVLTISSSRELMKEYVDKGAFLVQAYERFSSKFDYLICEHGPYWWTGFQEFQSAFNLVIKELNKYFDWLKSLEAEVIRIETLLGNGAN